MTGALEQEDPREVALHLVRAEASGSSIDGAAGALERLCRALARRLDLLGVVVRLAADDEGLAGAVVTSAGAAAVLAEIEVTAGEGPGRSAHQTGRPVVAADLNGPYGTEWPGFQYAAVDAGVAAVFAFPLTVGAVGFGSLELFSGAPGALSRPDHALARAFAELATETLLDGELVAADGALSPSLARAFDYHAEIAQAQGMVMVDMGISLGEAMALLRAHAFASGQPLLALARRVVGGYSIPTDGEP